jgi:hypothetical protein
MTKMNLKVCMCAAGLAVGLLAGTSSAQIIIMQAPNQVNGLFADTTFPQSMADDFVLGGDASLGMLTWYGGYFPSNTTVPDDFAIRIHGDSGGLPDGGAAFLNLGGVTPDSRTDTGIDLFGVDEYMYTFDLGGVNLGAGVYWLEIYNNTSQNDDNWFWETGDLDPVGGRADAAFAVETPGVNWLSTPGDQAFTIEVVPAPASLALLGLAIFCGVRRRRS